MKLHNHTHYGTRGLWLIAYRALTSHWSRKALEGVEITVVYGPARRWSHGCSGHAFYWRKDSAVVRVPRNGFTDYTKIDFAFVCVHEVAHSTFSIRHPDMRGSFLNERVKAHNRFAWAAEVSVKGEEEIPVPRGMVLARAHMSEPKFRVNYRCKVCGRPLRVKYMESTKYFLQKFHLMGTYRTREWGEGLPTVMDAIGLVLLRCKLDHEAGLRCGEDEVFVLVQEVPDARQV